MSLALCKQHSEKRYKGTAQELLCTSSSGATLGCNKHFCARHLSANRLYIPVLFIEHYLFASHKPQSHCCTAKEAFAAANNYRIRLLSRRNRSNLLIKDARPLCPCYTQGFANTAAFIEATELLLYKLSRRGRWLCATTAVAGLFRKSSRSYEMCDKGWVIA